MQSVDVVSFFTQALYLVLWLSLPPIVVGSVVGTLFSLFQALTQIQEQTLSFGVKLIAVSVTILLTARWVGGEMFNFTVQIFDSIPSLGR
ncbi:type III secretion protein HrpO [Acidovorax sp. Leaf76]|uniref:type III secretion system export apparatus subunit SctS n=1 Tax=unclassified Acidovorax TaxID=2684926 RepID=UPI0006F83003|nr:MULTISPECIES: type III secretion system export apparatus subunit SctS [unclassified Acidovorax]KQO20762.1 type III secretion protein HrpO [Acidovorax sp. Leaf76]KQO34025.1 type III secretion protein HrpO [Acidovorax sp. Leaf84]KQS36645.1 type III secretion protein HrpO [Acidovorax sp. Leaf191]RYF78812.1 MAG: EscS/YscS/HrcS family type III secretion system export apparatus protein [Comamonadaceae bacterium]